MTLLVSSSDFMRITGGSPHSTLIMLKIFIGPSGKITTKWDKFIMMLLCRKHLHQEEEFLRKTTSTQLSLLKLEVISTTDSTTGPMTMATGRALDHLPPTPELPTKSLSQSNSQEVIMKIHPHQPMKSLEKMLSLSSMLCTRELTGKELVLPVSLLSDICLLPFSEFSFSLLSLSASGSATEILSTAHSVCGLTTTNTENTTIHTDLLFTKERLPSTSGITNAENHEI